MTTPHGQALKQRATRRAIGIGIVILALVSSGWFVMKHFSRDTFDAAAWRAQAGKGDQDNPRAGMAATLTTEVLKPGMPRAEVLALLGPPDFQKGQKDYYELGRSAYGVDYEYLVALYEADALVRAYIERT